MSPNNYNSLVVLGPTASGKTRLACSLAAALDGEIISLDSRQVYKQLNLGTGKDLDEYTARGKRIPYHLIDIREPGQQFYLHDLIRELHIAFKGIGERHKLPVFCGGKGLYLDALSKDFSFTQVPEDHVFREQAKTMEKTELEKALAAFPEELVAHVDRSSKKRMLRGIEIARYRLQHKLMEQPAPQIKPLYLGLRIEKEVLHQRIRRRLLERMEKGMIAEAEGLLKAGLDHRRLQELGLEYKFLSWYLQGRLDREELVDKLFIAIRQYANRQMTWFRKMEREGLLIHWLNDHDEALTLVKKLLHLPMK